MARSTPPSRPARPAPAATTDKAATDKAAGPPKRLRVRATRMGFYQNRRRRVGDVFTLVDAKHFSAKWMEKVSAGTAERATHVREELARHHDETLSNRVAEQRGIPGAPPPRRPDPAAGEPATDDSGSEAADVLGD